MEQIKCLDYNWAICMSLQMVNFLLGQQSGYTKFPRFLFFWESRSQDQHYAKKRTELPLRTELKPVDKNVIANPLVLRDKIIFPLLMIKMGLIKQFTGIDIEKKWELLISRHFFEPINVVDQELGHLSNQ